MNGKPPWIRGVQRGFWCKMHAVGKFSMPSLDDAWLTAWEMFAYDGRIVTPYYCSTKRVYAIPTPPRYVGHPNPWRFFPAGYWRTPNMRRVYPTGGNRLKSCHGWHLTRSTNHILANPLTATARCCMVQE